MKVIWLFLLVFISCGKPMTKTKEKIKYKSTGMCSYDYDEFFEKRSFPAAFIWADQPGRRYKELYSEFEIEDDGFGYLNIQITVYYPKEKTKVFKFKEIRRYDYKTGRKLKW